MKVLVVGATGATGQQIVSQLCEQKIAVRAMVRDLDKAKAMLPEDIEYAVADLCKPSSLPEAMTGCDYIICAAAARPSFNVAGFFQVDYLGTKALINAAIAMGIKQFILVSSLCVSKFFHPLNIFGLVLFWKKQTENYLIESPLTHTIIRPGGLNTEAKAPLVLAPADSLFEGRIPRKQVAEICVAALNFPAAQSRIIEAIADPNAKAQSIPTLIHNLAN